ncbi:hypothetical protein FQZ97_1113710 [compost metagenome]
MVAVALPSEIAICTPERMSSRVMVTTEALLSSEPASTPRLRLRPPSRPPSAPAIWPVDSSSMITAGSR